ncbi:MAG: OmpA family protein [Vicinamibacterales bacterium]
MRFPRIPLVGLILVVAAAGACGRRVQPVATPVPPAEVAPVATPAPPPPPPPPAPAPVAAAPTEDELFAQKSLEALNAEAPLGDVFFEFDQATLSAAARDQLQRNATFLRRWPTTRVRVEGHCDERGTVEYNLSLGERRARAVRDYLVELGVDGGRLLGVSLGEEAPVCTASSEDCWQRNRRGHFVFTAK